MRKRNSNKGLTLVEIIVSLAIFGIIIIVLLDMLTAGVSGIASAGLRNKGLYKVQQTIENEIRQNTKTDSTNGSIGVDYTSISNFDIVFSSGTMTFVDGNVLDVTYDDGKRKVNLKTYLPK